MASLTLGFFTTRTEQKPFYIFDTMVTLHVDYLQTLVKPLCFSKLIVSHWYQRADGPHKFSASNIASWFLVGIRLLAFYFLVPSD